MKNIFEISHLKKIFFLLFTLLNFLRENILIAEIWTNVLRVVFKKHNKLINTN